MDCPKCGHQQEDTVKCESCGVYFAKVRSPQSVPATGRVGGVHTAPERLGFSVRALIVTALVSAAVVVYVVRGRALPPTAPQQSALVSGQMPSAHLESAEIPAGPTPPVGGLIQSRSAIESARNAVVIIKRAGGWVRASSSMDAAMSLPIVTWWRQTEPEWSTRWCKIQTHEIASMPLACSYRRPSTMPNGIAMR